MKPLSKIVVYSDLDGTLLSVEDYSFEPAREVLKLLKERKAAIVLVSSKTRAEIELYRRKMRITAPFIAENGGAIYVPLGYFPFSPAGAKRRGPFLVVELGTPYRKLKSHLKQVSRALKITVRGFGDMTPQEIAKETGLTLREARLAKDREYDEPFTIVGSEEEKATLTRKIERLGLRWTRGDRYFHITGNNDKGRACRILTQAFVRAHGSVTTVGVGDSLNDLPLLAFVDYPIVVKRADGTYDSGVKLNNLIRSQGIGPAGFNSSIIALLNSPCFPPPL